MRLHWTTGYLLYEAYRGSRGGPMKTRGRGSTQPLHERQENPASQEKQEELNKMDGARSRVKCYRCGQRGHIRRECTSEKRRILPNSVGDVRAVPRRTLQVGHSLTKRDISSLGTLGIECISVRASQMKCFPLEVRMIVTGPFEWQVVRGRFRRRTMSISDQALRTVENIVWPSVVTTA